MSCLIGLIGSDIGTSLSPALHEAEARHHGLCLCYRVIDLDEIAGGAGAIGDLVGWARRLGFDGLNVTHPCKAAVIPFLDELSEEAETLGAVNTVVFDRGRAIGHNTDGIGFAEGFVRGLPGGATGRVVQLGAGGAGAAVAHALLARGAGELTVVDVEPARATALAAELTRRFGTGRAHGAAPPDLGALLAASDGLVHATPTGMSHSPGMPLPPEILHPGLWVADIVYRPVETELLRHARRIGCRTLNGTGMLVFQAVHAFRLFTGVPPDADRMFAHMTELVTAQAALRT